MSPYNFDHCETPNMQAYDNATLVARVIGRASAVPNVRAPRQAQLGGLDPCYLENPLPTRRKNQHRPLVRVLTR